MTKARLLAEADSYELSQWAAFCQVEAEEAAAARAASNGHRDLAALTGGL